MTRNKCISCLSYNVERKYRITRFLRPFEIVHCRNCGLIWKHDTNVDIEDLYNEGYYRGGNEYSYIDEREDKFLREIELTRRIQNLIKFMPSKTVTRHSLLDIGCSFGALVDKAVSFDIQAKGYDISEYAINEGKAKGSNVELCDAQEKIVGKYSAITMIEVIEHLENPRKVIKNCFDALNDKGVLLIQTTNMDSIVRRVEGASSRYILPGHIYYFSKKNLTSLLNDIGFDIVKIYYGHETGFIPAIIRKSVANMVRFNKPDYLVLMYTIIAHLLSKLHIGNIAMHNGMVIIARKRGCCGRAGCKI